MYETRQLVALKAVVALPDPAPRSTSQDDAFIASISPAFSSVVNRQVLPAGAPPTAPHLLLQSTSSRLVVSSVQADFEVRFYGEFEGDLQRCLDYAFDKIDAVLGAFGSIGPPPSMLGLIATVNFPQNSSDPDPVEHIAGTHLRIATDELDLFSDCAAKVSMKLSEKHFLSFAASNYVMKLLERPLMEGQVIAVRPWEGEVQETGIELAIDLNNRLQAVTDRTDPIVDRDQLQISFEILKRAIEETGPKYVETGQAVPAEMEIRTA